MLERRSISAWRRAAPIVRTVAPAAALSPAGRPDAATTPAAATVAAGR